MLPLRFRRKRRRPRTNHHSNFLKKAIMLPISVFIIAKNEADRISYALKSVRDWAAEVRVIDSGSEDDTVAVSEQLGALVTHHAWQGYGQQKNFGESLCKMNWLLNLDADEEVTPSLRSEIEALFAGGKEPQFKAYSVTRKLMHFIESTGTYGMTDHPVRLYHKEHAGFKNSAVHDSVAWKSSEHPIGKLSGTLNHRCFRSYSHMLDKINFYSSMQAQDLYEKGRNPSVVRIVSEPLVTFLKAYFIRRYVLRGVTGFLEAIIYAFARTIRLAKARALFIQKQKND